MRLGIANGRLVTRRGLGAVVVVLLAVSCADDTPTAETDGPIVFSHAPSESADGAAAEVKGVLSYDEDNGCFLVSVESVTYPVVWPAGTVGVADGPGVRLPDGSVIEVGESVYGGGYYADAGSSLVPFDIPDACLPPTNEVALFNVNEKVRTT